MTEKVLITGANGQLGKELVDLFTQKGFEVHGFGREEMDITRENQVKDIIQRIKPEIIIHSAAYTKVDLAESEPNRAFAINAQGTKNVTIAAEELKAKLIYISTDYIFDGKKREGYHIDDQPNPKTVYGQSKLLGEEYVKRYSNSYFILRTSWVFGYHGSNFVKTMLKLASEKKEIGVVDDQIGSPTYTKHLADFIIKLVATNSFGIYHTSNTGKCSWYEFAKEIFNQTNKDITLKPLKTEEFPRPAKRPANSILNQGELEKKGFEKFPHWKQAVEEFLQEIKKNKEHV